MISNTGILTWMTGRPYRLLRASSPLPPSAKPGTYSTLQLWLHAWHLYKDTLLSFYPHRYLELSHYWHHIADLDWHFHWAAVLSYDAQFCHKCAIQGLPLSTFDQQLYITTLDATAAKMSTCRCSRCQHFDHEVIDCPFPPGSPTGEGSNNEEGCSRPAGLGKSAQTTTAVLCCQGLQLPTVHCLPPGQGDLH